MIIGISGKMGVGKDECFKQLKLAGVDCVQLSVATPLKDMVAKYWGYSKKQIKEKPPEVRSNLQIVGRMMREVVDPDFFTHQLNDLIYADKDLKKRLTSKKKHIVVTDLRYLGEVHMIRNEMLGIHIKVEREDEDNTTVKAYGKKQITDKSETLLENAVIDFVIKNNGSKKNLRESMFMISEHIRKSKNF
jgi:dephospho-CoA kinase